MAKLCEGLTVLDLTQGMAGGLATMVLADAGAEVIKIEPPSGDWSRDHPAWIMWNRGKKSVVLDLKTVEGRMRLAELAQTADIVVTSAAPATNARLGISHEELARQNGALVFCSITGFGPLGKYAHLKGYDAIVNTKTGRTGAFAKQLPGKDGPTYAALMCATFGAAMYALQGIMGALYLRERTGRGQMVETSLAQALFAYDWSWLGWQLQRRPDAPANAQFVRGSPTPQYIVSRTKDGRWLQNANSMSHLMVNFLVAAGLGDLYSEPRYQALPNIPAGPDMEELYQKIYARMLERTADEWMHTFMHEFDVACEPFRHTQEAFEHPQVVHNRNFVEIEDPSAGKTRQLGPLAGLSETPLEPQGPAPALGQHTAEILESIGVRRPVEASDGQEMPRYPLEGVKVVDFATWFAAPYGTAILADMGARVIKIESRDGDPFRRWAATGTKPLQGKESVALDLKTEEGRKICYEILKDADILLHNFRPGVPQRLGIDYETVRNFNPKIIYVYGGSYGSSGPMAHRAAMHPIPGAICGGAMYQAGRDMPPPADAPMTYEEIRTTSSGLFQANEGNPDSSSSLGVAAAMLMGLYGREKHGVGQYIETTMLNTCLYANADDYIQYEGKPPRTLPDGGLNGLHALYRFYPAKEGWAFLACVKEAEWRAFCEAVGRPDLLEDPRFTDRQSRREHDGELIAEIERVMGERTAYEWEWFLAEHGVACAESRTGDYAEWANTDDALRSAGLWITVEHPSLDKYERYGPAVLFSACEARLGATAYVGEHTQPVLREMGYSDTQLQDLKDRKVLTWSTRTMEED